MTRKTLCCTECGVGLTTADADGLVPTEKGPVHGNCYDGEAPGSGAADFLALLAEEEERRRDMGDPPVTLIEPKVGQQIPPAVASRQLRTYAVALGIGERCAESDHDFCKDPSCRCGCHRDTDDGLDRYDPEEERTQREIREEERGY